MANHAKVCTGNTLNPLEVDAHVQRLNKELLHDVFIITYTESDDPNAWGKYSWLLQYRDNQEIFVEFWLSGEEENGEEIDGNWVEYEESKVLSEQSCIEFRHGHGFQFLWWVEGVLRENLGKIYNARMWDDGCGWQETPASPERYETFEKYVRSFESANTNEKIELTKQFHISFEPGYTDVPSEIIEKLNLNFKV